MFTRFSRVLKLFYHWFDIVSLPHFMQLHCSKYLKEHCVFCHCSQYKCTHSPTHSKSWINEAKTCLPCDKFGYRLRMMFLDKNVVIPFQKRQRNSLCKNGIMFKYPFFKTKFKDSFPSNTTTQSFLRAK